MPVHRGKQTHSFLEYAKGRLAPVLKTFSINMSFHILVAMV